MARVLVIEDNQADLELLTYLLQSGGHCVIQAHGGQEGIGAALATKPDLILCDVRMPQISGFDVVTRLRREAGFAQIPVVAVTVLSTASDLRTALDAGFRGYMAKPIEPTVFLSEIDNYLHQPAPFRH